MELSHVIERVNMYGVVASMKNLDEVVLLKMSLDFTNGLCDYKMSNERYKFKDAVNSILYKLP